MGNIYDNKHFFDQYAQMSRSQLGLEGAGEWHQLRKLFPPLAGKKVLDLGCGYGWHCRFAAKQNAEAVLGIDQSERMIAEAQKRNPEEQITYRICDLEAYEYPQQEWEVVVSNLVLHYIEDLNQIFRKIYETLKPGGTFIFNIEHPVFTAGVGQDWIYSEKQEILHWPLDNYFMEGKRDTTFLGCQVEKQHHTLTSIVRGLLAAGFVLEDLEEAKPSEEMMELPGMKDELRRPMMLLVRAGK